MQKLTFTQKLLRQRRFLGSLLPLLALFVGLGAQQAMAQTVAITNSAITLITRPTSATVANTTNYAGSANDAPYDTYPALNAGGASPSTVPALGTYDLNNNSQLTLDGASFIASIVTSSTTISNTALEYRVFLLSTAAGMEPAYTPVTLNQQGSTTTYAVGGSNINLLNGLTSGGYYAVQVRFSGLATRVTTTTKTSAFYDLSSGAGSADNYTAVFYVTPPPFTPTGGTTTWISTTSTDWNLASNWSNGVPTATSNAVILDPSSIQYAYPVLDSPIGGPINVYSVNNLLLDGVQANAKAQLFVQLATLVVYGNLRQESGGVSGAVTGSPGVANANMNSTLILAGANQVVSGQLSMPDVVIAGSGVKSVINVLQPTNTLSFRPTSAANGAIVQSASETSTSGSVVTVFNTTGNTYIDLGASGIINQANTTGVPNAETTSSYVKGVFRVNRAMTIGTTQTFGNIGLELTPNHTPKGRISIVRLVGLSQLPPVGNGVGVKRIYSVSGDDDSETSTYAGYGSAFRLRYLDSADELNTILESNLLPFLSFNISGPYARRDGVVTAGATPDPSPSFGTNYVDRSFLESYPAYNITLGDRTRPLPVTLTKFDAKRMGVDAFVAWQTASELNSKGFEVQVSTDGKEFRTLTMVASKSANSVIAQSYSYLDTEAGKTGTRYYRLRQIDLDGGESFTTPVAVSFEGKASASSTAAVVYPNPFNSTDELHVALQSATAGTGTLLVTDMMGRTIRQQAVELTTGLADLPVSGLNDLKTGLYLIKLTLPSGEVKTVKVQKQ